MASDDQKTNDPKIEFGTGQPFYDSFARTPASGAAQTGKAPVVPAPPRARGGEPVSGGRGIPVARKEPDGDSPLDGEETRPGIWCSDCRQVMYTQYWAMNERPVCSKCTAPYRDKIAYGTGPAAFGRSLKYGAGAGLIGAIACALIFIVFGYVRVLCFAAIGWGIGTAVGKGNGDFGGKRYQFLAVALTWLAIGLAYMPSAIAGLRASGTMSGALEATVVGTHVVAAKAKHAGKERDELRDVLTNRLAGNDTTYDNFGKVVAIATHDSAGGDSTVIVDSNALGALLVKPPKVKPPGIGVILLFFFVFLITLPVMATIAIFSYSMYGAGIGMLALLYGLYKAWTLAEGGPELKIMGPYRVGTGPIKATL
ncbi:MAG: hypothetical protein M3081_21725 [Gemmatimonadota bacterium]|nr:hypothetical protein [Gemmatimonadota bacterium]